jgi:hypothetical protein
MYLNSTNASRQSGSTEKGVVVKTTKEYSYTIFIFSYYHENIADIGGIVDCYCLRGRGKGKMGRVKGKIGVTVKRRGGLRERRSAKGENWSAKDENRGEMDKEKEGC